MKQLIAVLVLLVSFAAQADSPRSPPKRNNGKGEVIAGAVLVGIGIFNVLACTITAFAVFGGEGGDYETDRSAVGFTGMALGSIALGVGTPLLAVGLDQQRQATHAMRGIGFSF